MPTFYLIHRHAVLAVLTFLTLFEPSRRNLILLRLSDNVTVPQIEGMK